MVPARGAKDRLDTPVASQKRHFLLSELSQTHHGRRGKTSITLRIVSAILKMTLFFSSEIAFYDAILQRDHHFYNNVSRGAIQVAEITTMYQIINIASLCP